MKHICSLILVIPASVYADSYTFTYYDPSVYYEVDNNQLLLVPDGTITSISDTFVYFDPLNSTATLTQTQWAKDSSSPTMEIVYGDVSFDYNNVTFANILDFFPWLTEKTDFMNAVFPEWRTTFIQTVDPHDIDEQYNIIQQQNIQLANMAFHHNTIRVGRNGGDTDYNVSVWGQALYSHGKKHGKNSFSANTSGAVFGVETEIAPSLDMGLGFEHNETSVNHDDISMNNNTLFLYGDYDTESFFMNGILAYIYGDYEYANITHHGTNNGLFASAIFGKHIGHGFSSEIGMRYNHITMKDKNIISRKLTGDVYTAVTGIEYKNHISKINLGGKVLVDYDFATPDNDVKLFIPNQTIHTKHKYEQNRLGTEIGLWTEYAVEDISLRLEYDLYYQSNYKNHTGRISFKYGF